MSAAGTAPNRVLSNTTSLTASQARIMCGCTVSILVMAGTLVVVWLSVGHRAALVTWLLEPQALPGWSCTPVYSNKCGGGEGPTTLVCVCVCVLPQKNAHDQHA